MMLLRSSGLKPRRPTQRKASVALILVLVLALLAGTFAASVARRASQERHNDQRRRSIAVLRSAMDSITEANVAIDAPLQLPLDDSSQRYVLVELETSSQSVQTYRATLFQNDQPGLFIQTRKTTEAQP